MKGGVESMLVIGISQRRKRGKPGKGEREHPETSKSQIIKNGSLYTLRRKSKQLAACIQLTQRVPWKYNVRQTQQEHKGE